LDILTGGDSTVTTTEEPAYEDVPPPPLQHDVPVWHQPTDGSIDLNFHEGRISLVVNDAPLNRVLSLIAQKQKLNVVCAENISARISVVLHDVTLDDVLTAVLSTAGYTWVLRHNILHVTSLSEANTVAPDIQGRRMEVFTLDYASGTDVDATIQGLLSPVGQSFLTNATSDDYRKPRDTIVVEDLPAYLARIRDYICQVDQPPRQVLIQVHILEVDLEDDKRHGVNFKHMASIFNNTIELEMKGAANPLDSPAFFARVGGGNLDALIECLKSTTDAKTLASPKLLVLDGQLASLQIGEQLGYRVTTTTETSTMESVNFLDVGVVLEVTPHISRDGRVLMQVKPKVSSGRINPETELPEEQTKQVETNVMLNNREGMVIGGLIQEVDSNLQSKVAVLGDLWLVGGLFQRRQLEKKRDEIIIILVPHVLPYAPCEMAQNDCEVNSACTSLFHGSLEPTCRPWDPQLPDFETNPRRIHAPGFGCWPRHRQADVVVTQPSPASVIVTPDNTINMAPNQSLQMPLQQNHDTGPSQYSRPSQIEEPSNRPSPPQARAPSGRPRITRLPPITTQMR
jgi:type IV pilus assembly protein PilQ